MSSADDHEALRVDLETRRSVIESADRSMLVEAAAGTGKTTLLTDRIVSGIRGGLFRLPEVVAITFTEKAAAELESRLRRVFGLRLRDEDLPEQDRRNLACAVEELDQAHISTIHAFCAALLRERPVEAGVDPEFDVLDETQADLLRGHCWDAWMSAQVQACEPPLVEALRAGIGVSATPRSSSLRLLAYALIQCSEVLDPSLFTLRRPEQPVERLAEDLRRAAGPVAAFIAENMRGDGNVDSRSLRDAAEWITATPAEDAAGLRSAACGLLARVDVGNAQKSFPKELREHAEAVFGALTTPAEQIGAHLACDLMGWLGGFVSFYSAEKRRRSVLDFHDLLLLAARLLRTDRAMRSYFKDRFKAVFVDEFQDTDPLQAEVVSFLCERGGRFARRLSDVELEPGKLFVVGDPKQSIYRFRGANVQVYEQFKRLFERLPSGAESVRVVSRSFRSTPPLIGSLNAIFARVFARGDDEPEGVYQAAHVPLVAGGDNRPRGPALVALCPPDPNAEELKKAPTARDLEARHLARVVRDLVEGPVPPPLAEGLADRPLTYGGIAFLLRALTDVGVYEAALNELGIPYRVVGGRTYYEREEIGETLVTLRAVDDPLDEIAIVGSLRSSYFGVSDEELFRYREAGGLWNYLRTEVLGGPAGEAMSALAHWHGWRNKVRPHVLLREMLDRTKAMEAFMLKPAGRQRLANVLKLMGQLRSLHRASAGTFRSIIDYLATLHERREAEEESSVVEPGDDFVLLMSVHKAKGLEFDAVCLPDLSRRFLRDVGSLVVDRVGRRVELSAGNGVRSAGYDELAELERENVLAEEKRLLYVAATRARRLLVLPLHWRAEKGECMQGFLTDTDLFAGPDEAPFGRERGGVFYWDLRVSGATVTLPAAESAAPQTTVEQLLAARERWKQDHDRIILRARSVAPILLPSEIVESGARGRQGASEGADGRQFGSLFHNVMRLMPLEAPVGSDEQEALARGLALMESGALGLGEDAAQQAARLAVGLMSDARFMELLQQADVVRQEVPFAVPLGRLPFFDAETEGVLEGRVDLLLVGKERTVILDYKTDVVEAGEVEDVACRYWPQLALYSVALEACGWLRGDAQLVLCFVRDRHMCTRALDSMLVDETGRRLRQCLSGLAGGSEGAGGGPMQADLG